MKLKSPFRRIVVVDQCAHEWRVTGATYRPAVRRAEISGFASETLVLELAYGVTTVTQQCQKQCRRVRSYTAPGQAQIPGFTWKVPS